MSTVSSRLQAVLFRHGLFDASFRRRIVLSGGEDAAREAPLSVNVRMEGAGPLQETVGRELLPLGFLVIF